MKRAQSAAAFGLSYMSRLLRARPKAERVHRQLAEIFHIERPGPTVTRFGGLYLRSRAFDWVAVFFTG